MLLTEHDYNRSMDDYSHDLYVNAHIRIRESDLAESFIRSSGPGGQNVNKVSTAVQLRFLAYRAGLPSEVFQRLMKLAGRRATKDGEIIIVASRFRLQDKNRQDARIRLVELISKAAEPPPPKRRKTKPTKSSVERRLKTKNIRSEVKKSRSKISQD